MKRKFYQFTLDFRETKTLFTETLASDQSEICWLTNETELHSGLPSLLTPPPPSAGSAGDREAAAHHNSMNDLTERETNPQSKEMKEGREGGNRWQKGRGGIGRESIISSERESELSFSGVIQLNNVWLFSVPTTNQPDRKRQRCNRCFSPSFFIRPGQNALSGRSGRSQVHSAFLAITFLWSANTGTVEYF